MNHAIRVHETGGPETLVWEEVPKPGPKTGEVLIAQKAVGLNYIDVYFRTGLYKVPSMPVCSTRIRERNALGLCGSGKWFHE